MRNLKQGQVYLVLSGEGEKFLQSKAITRAERLVVLRHLNFDNISEIADDLCVTMKNVKFHNTKIRKKLGLPAGRGISKGIFRTFLPYAIQKVHTGGPESMDLPLGAKL